MKQIKIKILAIVTAITVIISGSVVYGLSPKTSLVIAPHTYYYVGIDDPSELIIPENWEPAKNENFECGGLAEIPCSLEVPENQTLETYLTSLGSNGVMNEAILGRFDQ